MKRTISILCGAIISIGAMAQNALNHSSLCINKTFIELHKDKTKKQEGGADYASPSKKQI